MQRWKSLLLAISPLIVSFGVSSLYFHSILVTQQSEIRRYKALAPGTEAVSSQFQSNDNRDRRAATGFITRASSGVIYSRYDRTTVPSLWELSHFLQNNNDQIIPSEDLHELDMMLQFNVVPSPSVENGKLLDKPSSDTGYGFRRNTNKKFQRSRTKSNPFPIATVLLFLINIGVFAWLYQTQTPASCVSLDINPGQLSQDYGRMWTGHFSHFEVWHLGFNMMSLWSLGPGQLETTYGGLPLFLMTMSLALLTSLTVIVLQPIITRIQEHWYSTNGNTTHTLSPSMVGFSGILFVWMVVATLDSNHPSCPIFFIPNLCFETKQIFSAYGNLALRINLGPLVQLIFLQVVLPRVSFVGHLAGIVLGFFWHWNFLPSMELCQPAILFPLLWCLRLLLLCVHRPSSEEFELSDLKEFPCNLKTILLRFRRPRQTGNHMHNNSENSLIFIRNCLIILWVMQFIMLRFWSSWTLSFALLIIVFQLMICTTIGTASKVRSARIFFACTLIQIITDGFTMGGWFSLQTIWIDGSSGIIIWILRDAFCIATLPLVATATSASNTPVDSNTWSLFMGAYTQALRPLSNPIQNFLIPLRKICGCLKVLPVLSMCEAEQVDKTGKQSESEEQKSLTTSFPAEVSELL